MPHGHPETSRGEVSKNPKNGEGFEKQEIKGEKTNKKEAEQIQKKNEREAREKGMIAVLSQEIKERAGRCRELSQKIKKFTENPYETEKTKTHEFLEAYNLSLLEIRDAMIVLDYKPELFETAFFAEKLGNMVIDTGSHQMPFPKNPREYGIFRQRLSDAIVAVQSQIFTMTGDEKYKASAENVQNMTEMNLVLASRASLDEAEKAEALSQSMLPQKREKEVFDGSLKYKITEYTDALAKDFADIGRAQMKDPVVAYEQGEKLLQKLMRFREGAQGTQKYPYQLIDSAKNDDSFMGEREVFRALQNQPELKKTFSAIVERYIDETQFAMEKNMNAYPEFYQFSENLRQLFVSSKPFVESIQKMIAQMNAGEKPTDVMMEKWVHPAARKILASPYMEGIEKSTASGMAQRIALRAEKSQFPRMRNALQKNLLGPIVQGKKMATQIQEVANGILTIQGQGSGFKGFMLEKALPMTLSFAGSMLGFIPGVGTVGSLALMSLGTTAGLGVSERVTEGDWRGFDPKIFAGRWALGCATGALAGFLGNKVLSPYLTAAGGRIMNAGKHLMLGRAIQRFGSGLSSGAQGSSLLKVSDKWYNPIKYLNDIVRPGKTVDFATMQEEGNEILGQGQALETVASLFPLDPKNQVSLAEKGSFEIFPGAKGYSTGDGISIRYDASVEGDMKQKISSYLQEKGMPEHIISAFSKADGKLDMNWNGVVLKIAPMGS
jgi:hypothetical protein